MSSLPNYNVMNEEEYNECVNVKNANLKNNTYTIEDVVEKSGFGHYQIRLFCITGILTAADAMEMLLLSVLGPALRCYWQLSAQEIAAITTIVFVGFLFGSPFWGFVSDRYGRWITLFIVLSMITYFGVLTSLSPTYIWVMISRFMVGFAIGGASSSFTLLSEFLSIRHRAKVLIGYNVFWAIGSTFEVGLAYLIMPNYGWRWLVFISAIPVGLFLLLLKFLPESPRYLLGAGQVDEAQRIVSSLLKANKTEPIEGTLYAQSQQSHKLGSLKSLFEKTYLSTTLLLPTIWFSAAFLYYGIVLISVEIFRFKHTCFGVYVNTPDFHGNWSAHNIGSISGSSPVLDTSCCQDISNDDYVAMIISSIGEFVNIPIMMYMVDRIGRKYTLVIWNGLTGLSFIMLYICMPKIAMTIVLFITRALAAGLLNLIYVYTTEVYPTSVRAVAVGTFSSIARLGAIITPYVAQVMMPEVSQLGALCLYACVGMTAAIFSYLLSIETKGRELPNFVETSDEVAFTKTNSEE